MKIKFTSTPTCAYVIYSKLIIFERALPPTERRGFPEHPLHEQVDKQVRAQIQGMCTGVGHMCAFFCDRNLVVVRVLVMTTIVMPYVEE